MGFRGPTMFINRLIKPHPSAAGRNIGLIAAPRPTYVSFKMAIRKLNPISDDTAENHAECNRHSKLAHALREISKYTLNRRYQLTH
jgi:hypothetical protein